MKCDKCGGSMNPCVLIVNTVWDCPGCATQAPASIDVPSTHAPQTGNAICSEPQPRFDLQWRKLCATDMSAFREASRRGLAAVLPDPVGGLMAWLPRTKEPPVSATANPRAWTTDAEALVCTGGDTSRLEQGWQRDLCEIEWRLQGVYAFGTMSYGGILTPRPGARLDTDCDKGRGQNGT